MLATSSHVGLRRDPVFVFGWWFARASCRRSGEEGVPGAGTQGMHPRGVDVESPEVVPVA